MSETIETDCPEPAASYLRIFGAELHQKIRECERLREAVDWCLKNCAGRGFDDNGNRVIFNMKEGDPIEVPFHFSEIIKAAP